MWLATKYGFYSIVAKQSDEFHIRARVKKDLETIARRMKDERALALPEVETWPGADYRYRIRVDRRTAIEVICQLGQDIDYSNFKSEIGSRPDQRAKLSSYHRIWAEMATHQQ